MFRFPRSRLLGALLAIVYIALPGGAAGVRACAHHDVAGIEQPDGGVAGEPGHSHHGGASDASPDSGETESEPHSGCSCLDACATAAAVALPSPVVTSAAADGDRAGSPQDPAADSPHISRPDHFLPYPHGPPIDPG